MASFQVRCPQCSLLLGAAGSGQVKIRCAACGTVFGVQIAQPVSPAAPPPPPPPPPPQSFASFQAVPNPTAVQNLCALGFPEAQARAALSSSDGDVERAATLLLATPCETSHAASPAVRAPPPPPEPVEDAEDRELQQAIEASRRESQQSSIPVAVAVAAPAGSNAPVAVATAVAVATTAAAAASTAGARAPPLLNTTVELQRLARRPELNGQQGIAETFEHGRYQVLYLVINPPRRPSSMEGTRCGCCSHCGYNHYGHTQAVLTPPGAAAARRRDDRHQARESHRRGGGRAAASSGGEFRQWR